MRAPALVGGDFYIESVTCGPFCLHGLALVSAWISDYVHYKGWDGVTCPFLEFNDKIVGV